MFRWPRLPPPSHKSPRGRATPERSELSLLKEGVLRQLLRPCDPSLFQTRPVFPYDDPLESGPFFAFLSLA